MGDSSIEVLAWRGGVTESPSIPSVLLDGSLRRVQYRRASRTGGDLAAQKITFDKFLFWDHIHPTGVVQAAWAEGLIAAVAVPESTTLGLVALGLGLLFFVGRRRSA